MGFVAMLHGSRGQTMWCSRCCCQPVPFACRTTVRGAKCVLAWDDQPLGGQSAPRAALLFQKPATWPIVVCLSEGAATDFVALF